MENYHAQQMSLPALLEDIECKYFATASVLSNMERDLVRQIGGEVSEACANGFLKELATARNQVEFLKNQHATSIQEHTQSGIEWKLERMNQYILEQQQAAASRELAVEQERLHVEHLHQTSFVELQSVLQQQLARQTSDYEAKLRRKDKEMAEACKVMESRLNSKENEGEVPRQHLYKQIAELKANRNGPGKHTLELYQINDKLTNKIDALNLASNKRERKVSELEQANEKLKDQLKDAHLNSNELQTANAKLSAEKRSQAEEYERQIRSLTKERFATKF
ncbi:Hypothetical predicted protein [Lecanosticta acicola]|uniref:Uncharacterized protein n=1 Tax=Lecanosticta acicola TaxID=111012 RepID=A0AAI8Z6L0_9PEZI|nr:Hypothetical predicted protein [Lecanosticta acicola]